MFIMTLMVIAFPLAILFYDTDAFFLLVSFVLLYLSVVNIKVLVAQDERLDEEASEEYENEFAEINQTLGINIYKLGYGFIIAVDLIFITYFIYSFLMLDILFLKSIAIILMADWLYDIIRVIDHMINGYAIEENKDYDWKAGLNEFYLWMHNIMNIGFIIVTFMLMYIM